MTRVKRALIAAALTACTATGASGQQDLRFQAEIHGQGGARVVVDVLIARDTMFVDVSGSGLPASVSVPILVFQGPECGDGPGIPRGSGLFGVSRDLVFRAPRGPHYGVSDSSGNLRFRAVRAMSLMDAELKAQTGWIPDARLGAAALRRLAGRPVSVSVQTQGPVPVEIGCSWFRAR